MREEFIGDGIQCIRELEQFLGIGKQKVLDCSKILSFFQKWLERYSIDYKMTYSKESKKVLGWLDHCPIAEQKQPIDMDTIRIAPDLPKEYWLGYSHEDLVRILLHMDGLDGDKWAQVKMDVVSCLNGR